MPKVDLLEQAAGAGRVDRAAGVIRGVRIINQDSQNGRRYTEACLRKAAPLYENVKVRADHPERQNPGQDRRVDSAVGWLSNVRMERGGLVGDLHLLKSHPLAESIFEAAERNPSLFGLSHNAKGLSHKQGDTLIVEEIVSVRGVDLVDQPAATSGLFESLGSRGMDAATFARALRESVDAPDAPKVPEEAEALDGQEAIVVQLATLASTIDQVVKLLARAGFDVSSVAGEISDAAGKVKAVVESLRPTGTCSPCRRPPDGGLRLFLGRPDSKSVRDFVKAITN